MLPPPHVAHVPNKGGPVSHGVCLLRPIRTVSADPSATFEYLGNLLRSHGGITRVTVAALSFTLIFAISQQAPLTKAGPEPAPVIPESLLPQNVGIGIPTVGAVTIPFEAGMDPASVEQAVQVLPEQDLDLTWNDEHSALTIRPDHLWRTDQRYLVVVAASAATADGEPLAKARRFSFTTQTAPVVSDFQIRLAGADVAPQDKPSSPSATLTLDPVQPDSDDGLMPPTKTATRVSATSAVEVAFSAPMDHADVEDHFAITPKVPGELSWAHGNLVFKPTERLEAGARYTISVIGSHDRVGNPLGGKGNFSFHVRPGAQITKTDPAFDAKDVEPEAVEMWFSQPMDVDATNEAFALTDTSTDALVGGHLSWNDAGTQLVYVPDDPFSAGRTFEVSLDKGARDTDGNAVTASWSFSTKAAPAPPPPTPTPSRSTVSTRSAPAIPPPAPATSLAGYALNQVNAARAAYGFAPLVLDAQVSAVAAAHAWDQARNGYFSHTGLDGSTRETRLARGGVGFGWSGENQCYHTGMSQQATLNWCHAQFMAEPYPGYWNHIANILSPNARRMGVGIATVGDRTVITWDFTD